MILSKASRVPSTGMLLGSKGISALQDNINMTLGNSNYFGSDFDIYKDQRNSFIQTFVEPIRQASTQITFIKDVIAQENSYRPITTEEDLRRIPPVMIPAVLTDPTLYSLLKQGRVQGWGYSADDLEYENEMYNRLINNGTICTDDLEPEEGTKDCFTFECTWTSEDEDLSEDDLEAIEITRDYVNKIINENDLDPTDMDSMIG